MASQNASASSSAEGVAYALRLVLMRTTLASTCGDTP